MNHEVTIFEQALAIREPGEREAYLRGACAGDAAMLERLQGLLRAHDLAGGFLEHKPHPAEAGRPEVTTPGPAQGPRLSLPATEPDPARIARGELYQQTGKGGPAAPEPARPAGVLDPQTPQRIGRYKLLQKIGEGGCGLVYMAEQQEPVRRRVALKIIKPGMDTRQVVARFEAERQALALMDHPNIARILDGGVTENGGPFFVMDLVQGLPIIQFCDEAKLSTRDRLALFLEVCSGIQHAHQKGVIHRDIKPSNILVTLRADGSGLPKIIDFGIAKATQQPLTDKTLFTQFQQLIGTPAYMSPEQATLTGFDIDTRSDIYSLGVLLYELLTGRTPFDSRELLQAGLDELRRTIREKEPARPSNRVSTLPADELTTTAKRRGVDASRLVSVLRGDLDWIVMQCLEKDRARRYETANELAHDIERHLRDEPVRARPPSRLYEFQKTVRRHWVGFAAVAGVVAALAIGLTVSTFEAIQARIAEREQIRLREAAQKAEANEATQRQQAQRLLYWSMMTQAQQAWEQQHTYLLRQILSDTAAYPDRGFEWYYWRRQVHLPVRKLWTGQDRVLRVAFSPDGRRLATAGADGTAKVWDVASSKCLFSLEGHSNVVRRVAFSPDGRRILTVGGFDETARMWDAATGREVFTRRLAGTVVRGAFFRDGARVLTFVGEQTLKVWDVSNGTELSTLRGVVGSISDLEFSPNGRRILTVGTTAQLWDASSGRALLTLKGHSLMVNCAAFSPDGRRIVTGSYDGTAKVWEAATEEQMANWQKEFSAGADRDREAAAAAERERALRAQDPGRVRRWLILAPITFESPNGEVPLPKAPSLSLAELGSRGAPALAQEQISDEAGLNPRAGERVKVGVGEMRWRAVQLDDYLIDFNRLVGFEAEWSVAYAVCYLESETEQTGLVMKVGSDDQSKVYLNGKEIYRCEKARSYAADLDEVANVRLKAGVNVLVFKVVNTLLDWKGSIRFTDSAGQPVRGIRVTLEPR
jgi:serine/threonine protein kinase